jgi:hypothetical protein
MAAVSNILLYTTPPFEAIGNQFNNATISTVTSTPTVTFTNGSADIGGTFNTTNVTIDSRVVFTTTGALPTNFALATTYYVVSISSTIMRVAAVRDGTAIIAGSAGSGIHTATIVKINQAYMTFVPPVSITCTRIAFYSNSSASLNGTDNIRGSIQTAARTTRGFAENARPSGILVGTGTTVASNTLNATGWNQITGLSATLTAGVPYAVTLEPTAAWTASIVARMGLQDSGGVNPFQLNNWFVGNERQTHINGMPLLLYGSSTDWYGFPCPDALPANQTNNNPSAGSGYVQSAITFQVPSSVTSYKVAKVSLSNIRMAWGTSPVVFRIMDSTGTTTLQQTTNRTDALTMFTQVHTTLDVTFEGTLATLLGGTTYLLVVEYQGGDIQMYTMDINNTYNSAMFNTFAGLTEGKYQYRSGTSGVWTTVTAATRMNPIGIQLSDMILPGGSSSGGSSASFTMFNG